MALAVNYQVAARTRHSLFEPTARRLRRSNALRIKSNNFHMLPAALRETLQAIRGQIPEINQHEEEEEEEHENELTLLEQIKRGVKLKPVSERDLEPRKHKLDARKVLLPIDTGNQEESLSTLLMRVLRQRYLAMQQAEESEDDDIDCDRSDTSSIHSGDLYLLDYECNQQSGLHSCVLYGTGGTIDKSNSKRRQTLLERLGDYSTVRIRARAMDLTNDLVIRL